MTDKPTHYILSNGAAIFVKTAEFFEAQGGLTEDWGRAWRPVVAGNIEDARALGDLMFPAPDHAWQQRTRSTADAAAFPAVPTMEALAWPSWISPLKLAEIRRNLALGANLPQVTQRFLLAVMIDEVARLRGAGGALIAGADEGVPVMPGLTFAEVTAANLARCNRWHPGGITDWSVADWATALMGEAGEACNAIKKLRRIDDGIANKSDADRQLSSRPAAVEKIGEELADTFLYLNLLACRLGINLAGEIVRKFNATSERYGFPERLGGDGRGAPP